MSAELLREAAALMRQRAEAAVSRPPWTYDGDESTGSYSLRDADGFSIFSDLNGRWDDDLPHIASWHPAVALAVADWLEATASVWDHAYPVPRLNAERVARAYLGRSDG